MAKAYYFEYDQDFGGVAIIAENARQAKKLLWEDNDVRECCGGEWVYLKVRWLKDADTEGLEIGHLVGIEGLKRGIYSNYYAKCSMCGVMGTLIYDEEMDTIYCQDCGWLIEDIDSMIYDTYQNVKEIKHSILLVDSCSRVRFEIHLPCTPEQILADEKAAHEKMVGIVPKDKQELFSLTYRVGVVK